MLRNSVQSRPSRPLVDSLLLNEERSFTPFPLMKRTLAVHFSSPPSFRRGNVFHLFPPVVGRSVGRPDACVLFLAFALTHARNYTRTLGRGRAFSTCVCATRLRHGGSVACRNVRLKERLARTGSLPFPRRRPPKGVSELHQRDDSRRLTMDRVLTARLSVKREGAPGERYK